MSCYSYCGVLVCKGASVDIPFAMGLALEQGLRLFRLHIVEGSFCCLPITCLSLTARIFHLLAYCSGVWRVISYSSVCR